MKQYLYRNLGVLGKLLLFRRLFGPNIAFSCLSFPILMQSRYVFPNTSSILEISSNAKHVKASLSTYTYIAFRVFASSYCIRVRLNVKYVFDKWCHRKNVTDPAYYFFRNWDAVSLSAYIFFRKYSNANK